METYKKIILIIALVIAIVTDVHAFMVSDCPVDGKSITGIINSRPFFTDTIDCEKAPNTTCSYTIQLFYESQPGLYEIYDIPLFCTADDIFLDEMRLFIENGKIYMPLVNESENSIFTSGSKTYVYPDEVPIYRFNME